MLIKEYRIPLPLTVEEYRIAQLYMIAKKSREESSGAGSGVEILINEPYTHGPGGQGQYTKKIYHVGSHLPGWIKGILPKTALMVEEEAWNAYPYTKTRYTCPFVEKFSLEIETYYYPDNGHQENVFQLSGSDLRNRIVDVIDVVKDQLYGADYVKEEDPLYYVSEKSGRGPLSPNWLEEYWDAVKGKQQPLPNGKSLMCAYKLCKVEFRYWGMQTKIERFIHDTALRKTMVRAHRQAWAWQDEWHGLTMENIREIERQTQLALKRKMGQLEDEIDEDDNLGNSTSKEDHGRTLAATLGSIEVTEDSPLLTKCSNVPTIQTAGSSDNDLSPEDDVITVKRDDKWQQSRALHSPSSASIKSFDLQVANWRIKSLGRDSGSSSDEEFFDCEADDSIFSPTYLQRVASERGNRRAMLRGKINSLEVPCPESPSASPHNPCNTTVLILVLHAGSVLEFIKSEEGQGFSGQVCFVADSIGSILAYDSLCRTAKYVSRHGSENSILESDFQKLDDVHINETGHLTAPSPRRRSSSTSDQSHIKLDFEVSDVFMFGSPLALVLAYRKISSQDDKTNNITRPTCLQVYNLFHPTDPVAARLEPLLSARFSILPPVNISRYAKYPLGNGQPYHLVQQKWWGGKRMDYALYCPEGLSNFPTNALPHLFHASYWESCDVIAFILRQIGGIEVTSLPGDNNMEQMFRPGQPREKWIRKRTSVKLKNVTANHRANDVIVRENAPQVLTARFMYGPLDMITLTGEKVDIHVMKDAPLGEWTHLSTEVTDKAGRITFCIPEEKALTYGLYPIKMVVRGDHTAVDFFLAVVPPKTECIVFSIDGSFTASVSVTGRDPKVRAGAVDVVRHWQELGYLIIYITGRPDMQHRRVVSWLSQHNFPHGLISFADGLSTDPLGHKAAYLNNLVEVRFNLHCTVHKVKKYPDFFILTRQKKILLLSNCICRSAKRATSYPIASELSAPIERSLSTRRYQLPKPTLSISPIGKQSPS
uniref:Protein retinal degeneration B-like n=1 Tax=Diabrotica virgifera virgifera TaxID=50390 RepID=A0A6P7GDF1_DIAVI